MSLNESIKEALGGFLRDTGRAEDVERVTSWEDRTEYGGYCETCSYEETVVDITYRTTAGGTKTYTYYGSFADLVSAL